MRKTLIRTVQYLLLLASIPAMLIAQTSNEGNHWEFLPERTRVMVLAASPTEPRLGLRKEIGSSRMQLDVGASLDLVEYTPSAGYQLRLAVALFSYALTTSNQGLNLQIDAVDGFYGGHLSLQKHLEDYMLLLRLRFIHHSAHFVDGHVDPATGWWKENREPVPFTKDFVEVVVGTEWRCSGFVLQISSGIAYSTKVRPAVLKRLESMHGVEWRTDDNFLKMFGKPVNLYASYTLAVAGAPVYIGTNRLEAGGKFGRWTDSGIRLFAGYHNGLEVFGQYYDVRRMYWHIGFALDW